MSRRAAFVSAYGACAAVLLLILTWLLAFHVGFVRRADANILGGFVNLDRPRVDSVANFIAHLCDPQPYVYFAGAVILVALGRRRPGVALVIAMILFGANVTTQLLKPLLAGPRPILPSGGQIGAASWPSGHATASMSLALCATLAVPARLRPAVAALGGLFAVAVTYSFLALGWHYPSDVFGGFLVATAWTLFGVALLFATGARSAARVRSEPADRVPLREALRAPALALLGALSLAALIALARPHQVVAYAQAHTAFVVGAAAIGALGLSLATGVMLALRR